MATSPEDKKLAANRLASPSNIFPGNQLQGSSGFSGAPIAPAAASAPAAAPAPAGMSDGERANALAQIPTEGVKGPAADGSQDAWSNTEAGRNVVNTLAALPGLGGVGRVASTGGAISRGVNATSALANNAGRAVIAAPLAGSGILGGAAMAAESLAAPAGAVRPAISNRPSATSPAVSAMSAGLVNNVGTPPATASTAVASDGLPDGFYKHGRGQYSDQAGGMGFATGFTGQPNAQNQRAAASLAAMNSPILAEQQGGVPAFTAPTVVHSGNDWAARNNLRNLEVSASSITNRPEWRSGSTTTGWNGRNSNPGQADPDGKIGRFNAAMQADLAAQGKAPDLQQRTNEVNAGLQRAAMGEAGADRRAALAESGASSRAANQMALGVGRLNLDQQRAASDERLRAPQIRAAERLGQLQDAYVNAKTPEEQSAISAQIRAYSGKEDADWKVQVTPATKNVDGSTTAGSVIRYNSRTGDVQDVGGVGGKASTPSEHNINALRANPKLREQFDQQFGTGAAARYLG